MTCRSWVLAVALVGSLFGTGCASTPRMRTALPSRAISPMQGTDTGALASDTTRPSAAWPGTRREVEPNPGYVGPEPRPVADQDREITRRIGAAVLSDRDLDGRRNVVITTHRGVVTLRGNVATPADRARLVEDARSIPGVSNVNDELRVSPSP